MSSDEEFEYGSPARSPYYSQDPGPAVPKTGLKLRLPALKPKRAPRLTKQKPLPEVLTRLIAIVKKKDVYGFFLTPVDVDAVQGYSRIVPHPMDFGTIEQKISARAYRTLEDFKNDVILVTKNAKAFNPPGSVYHVEASKIEVWAKDQMGKAEGTAIEPDEWSMDVDQEGSNTQERDISEVPPERESSVLSSTQATRRGVRGPYTKKVVVPVEVKDLMDSNGRLPGRKQGIAAFPAMSDWAEAMVVLKLRGKRYKTKKERLRVEKEGPPLCADGSLNIAETEDPFTLLSAIVPDDLGLPELTPLYPSQPRLAAPTNLLFSARPTTELAASPPIPSGSTAPARRHWVISRGQPTRRVREDDEPAVAIEPPTRTPVPTDYGPYAILLGQLEEEMRIKVARSVTDPRRGIESEEGLLNTIHATLNVPAEVPSAAAAAEYLSDVVYGGILGLAYIRSIAEFVGTTTAPVASNSARFYPLGLPLPTYVEQSIVNPLTRGRHTILKQTATHLVHRDAAVIPQVAHQVRLSLDMYPRHIASLKFILQQPVDLASLVHTAHDLLSSADQEWAGKAYMESSEYIARRGNVQGVPQDASEDRDVWAHVLGYSTQLMKALDRKIRETPGSLREDELRHLRMNLLALSKRMPVDRITMPQQLLVPPSVGNGGGSTA